MLNVFTPPSGHFQITYDRQRWQGTRGRVTARTRCPSRAVTRPELHISPVDWERQTSLPAALMSAVLCASTTTSYSTRCGLDAEHQSDLSPTASHLDRVLSPLDSSIRESLGKTQTWQRQAGKSQPRMTL